MGVPVTLSGRHETSHQKIEEGTTMSKRGIVFCIAVTMAGLFAVSRVAGAEVKLHWPKTMTVAGGPIGGTFFQVTQGYAKVIQEKLGIPASVEVTGGATHNT